MTENIAKESYVRTDLLRDGRKVSIRAIRPEDKPVLQETLHHLSKQSQYFRFFTPKDDLTEKELEFFTDIDFVHHVGLLASIVSDHEEFPAGVGRYIMSDDETGSASAELAFTVAEEFQGMGIGTNVINEFLNELKTNYPDILRVELIARKTNPAIKLYKKLGFVKD